MTFQRRVIAITGAGSGIGRALAVEMGKRGADLSLCDIDEAGLSETAALLRERNVTTTRVDVADRSAMESWAADTLSAHGKVDAIVNNAGVTVQETIADITYEDFEWIVGINLWGVVHGTKAFLPHLLERDTGWVVNVSSVFGMIGFPGQGSYNATKFAVRGMTEALRWELEETGVTVCSVHPGGIRTNIVRNGRMHSDPLGRVDPKDMAAQFEKMARTTPEEAACVIANGMAKNEPRILIGNDARAIDAIQRVAPRRYGNILKRLADVFDV
jgi:NAD(P)-dependent dehydrogenase (short-subunit alcohol dehydrogenase family)